MKVLLLGKGGDSYCQKGIVWLRTQGIDLEAHTGKRQDPFPSLQETRYDFIFSYLSPWIVPARLLEKVRKAAINFHPGPPEYPGIGCTNFALYHNVKEFGVTAHHMLPKVDSGEVIMIKRFPVYPEDTVWTLTQRCYEHILPMFQEVVGTLLSGKALEPVGETWKRKPYQRLELDALCRVTPEMTAEEIKRRIRATVYPGYKEPHIELAGYRFHFGGKIGT